MLALEPNGGLVYNVVDKGKEDVDWQTIPHERTGTGVAVRLGVEVTDYDEGLVRLTVDGQPVLGEDMQVKNLKKATRDLFVGAFASAPGSRNVNVAVDNVRIVETK